ncbi:hypothetical protein QE152_g34332 [Popillia japonica]|uniref:Uncharacterized protein n=1 Tax=Popillia japonica TaxID=7064 RepID=A0AAW1ITU2_POPJA
MHILAKIIDRDRARGTSSRHATQSSNKLGWCIGHIGNGGICKEKYKQPHFNEDVVDGHKYILHQQLLLAMDKYLTQQ